MTSSCDNLYLGLCAEYYDIDQPTAPHNELQFYLNYAKKSHGPLLAPLCGTGRFLIPLLECGFNIEGFDASPTMLQLLKIKAAKKNLMPHVNQTFLEQFSSPKKYGLILIPSGSFGLITDLAQAYACLQILYDHLLPRAQLIFEVDTPQAISLEPNELHTSTVRKDDGSFITLNKRVSYNSSTQIVEITSEYTHHNDEVIKKEMDIFCIKLYQSNDLDQFLAQLGFSVVKYITHDTSSASDETLLIYECTKNI